MSEMINIPGRLHAVTSEGVITNTNEILDETSGKKQDVINTEVGNKLVSLETGLASKQKILTAGVGITIAEDGTISTTVDSSVGKIIQDHTQFTEPVEGVLYLELTANGSVFTEYIYKNNSWIDLGYLELTFGFDDIPTSNSTNAVKSGGIKAYVDNLMTFKREIYPEYAHNREGYWRLYDYDTDNPYILFAAASGWHCVDPIPIEVGDEFDITTTDHVAVATHALLDENKNFLALLQEWNTESLHHFTITQAQYDAGGRYVVFSFRPENSPSVLKKYTFSPKENDERVTNIEKQIELNIFDNIRPVYAFSKAAPAAFRNKLALLDHDIEILMIGDSITAYTHVVSENEEPDAANRPCGMQRNGMTWWMWNSLCNNKPQCDRFDSAVNVFTESEDNWQLSDYRKFNNVSGYNPVTSNGEVGEFSQDNSVYRECNATDAYITFDWDLDAYEKLAFIHRLGCDGTTAVQINCSEGKVEVYDEDTDTWVEANSYEFSQFIQYISPSAGGSSCWIRQKILKLRKAANASGIITLTLTNATGDGYMYYWGTERWNGNTLRVINLGKAGRPSNYQLFTIHDEIYYRHPDLIIYQLPVWNELKTGGSYTETWNIYHKQVIDLIKAQSDNWNNYQMMIYIPHTQVADWDKDRNKRFQKKIVPGQPVPPLTNEVSMTELTREELLLSGYDLNVPVLNLNSLIIDFAHSLGLTMQTFLGSESDAITDGTTAEVNVTDKYTTDGVHMSKTGAKFVANCLLPMLK